jgi:hypothetical protein
LGIRANSAALVGLKMIWNGRILMGLRVEGINAETQPREAGNPKPEARNPKQIRIDENGRLEK